MCASSIRSWTAEFKKALETLALSHDTQKKAVAINFVGEGKREVRVGYVVENPIWKTSYRLVLDKQKEKPFLQGWAMVENPTDEDWKDVRMALVSGRPISFQMDLYQPLYVHAAGRRAGAVRLAAPRRLQRRLATGTSSDGRPLRSQRCRSNAGC